MDFKKKTIERSNYDSVIVPLCSTLVSVLHVCPIDSVALSLT